MSMLAIINLMLFTALLSGLFQLGKMQMSLSRRVLAGLIAGSLFGLYLQGVFGVSNAVTSQTGLDQCRRQLLRHSVTPDHQATDTDYHDCRRGQDRRGQITGQDR